MLIAAAMGAGACMAGRVDLLPTLAQAGEWIGIALQHRNDIQDFTVTFEGAVKPPLADLLTGQVNLVVCCLLQATHRFTPSERQLFEGLLGRHRGTTRPSLTEREFSGLLELTVKYGAAAKAARKLTMCVERSRATLGTISGRAIPDAMHDYLDLILHP